MLLALAVLLQTQSGPWDDYKRDAPARVPKEGDIATNPRTGERIILRGGRWVTILGAGQHTLVVSDGNGMTRIEYKSGASCERARDTVQRQVAPPPNSPGIIYGPARMTAVCVPR